VQRPPSLINDGETIILDSGTTTLEIARQIKNKRGLQIITNGINIAAELLDARRVQTFIVGGTVRGDSASIIGRSTEDMFEQFRADKLFLCGAGYDPEFGVSGTNLEETMVNRTMLRISREIILVADASKFSIRSMSRIAPFSGINSIVSDVSLHRDVQERLRSLGCRLIWFRLGNHRCNRQDLQDFQGCHRIHCWSNPGLVRASFWTSSRRAAGGR
jgi:DeoR family transcriptional regulator, aga operon transcriptional repressor